MVALRPPQAVTHPLPENALNTYSVTLDDTPPRHCETLPKAISTAIELLGTHDLDPAQRDAYHYFLDSPGAEDRVNDYLAGENEFRLTYTTGETEHSIVIRYE